MKSFDEMNPRMLATYIRQLSPSVRRHVVSDIWIIWIGVSWRAGSMTEDLFNRKTLSFLLKFYHKRDSPHALVSILGHCHEKLLEFFANQQQQVKVHKLKLTITNPFSLCDA